VTEEQAAAILSVMLRPGGGEGRWGGAGKEHEGSMSGGGDSLAEFFRRVEPRRNPDKIVTIAEYLKAFECRKLVAGEEVLARFKDAGEPAPRNFNRDLRWARQTGWIALDQVTSKYYVTASGSKAVADRFPDDVTKATAIKGRRGARRRRPLTTGTDE